MATMEGLVVKVCLISSLFAIVCADKVPVLMWSPSRPLSDLPQAFAGNSIDGNTFKTDYITPLTKKTGQHVVAFLQDKLHMDDFTKYADVYNPFSDGGAFKNIKSLMDDHFSLNLPAVHSPKTVIDSLMKEFQGRMLKASHPDDIDGLKIEENKSYLIIVQLPATSRKNEEGAISQNDERVGEMVKRLAKRSLDYTAVFTGERSQRSVESTHTGRRLLAAADNVTGIFINVTEGNPMFFYSRDIWVTVITRVTADKVKEKIYTPIHLPADRKLYDHDGSYSNNNTAFFRLSTNKATANVSGVETEYNVTFWLSAVFRADRWAAVNFTLNIKNMTSGSSDDIPEQMMDTRNAELVLPPFFSYHCSNITFLPKGSSNESDTVYAVIRFEGLQFQPFGIRNDRFSEAWDCVGFFTTPIWMGLVPVGIFTVILFFGMYMITQLSTMDRFDDPKGKTITVNVNE